MHLRAVSMLVSGLLLGGLAASAAAGKNDWEKDIPACGPKTRVVKLVDYDDESGGEPVRIVTAKEKKRKGCQIAIDDLHPTQSAVGMAAAACKSGRITAKARQGKLTDYLLDDGRWVPMVRGPGGKFYLTDHHHLSTAVLNADLPEKQKKLYAYLLKDWSDLSEADFWAKMEKHNLTWLQSPDGKRIKPAELPHKIAGLQDDPLRTLSAWVRGSCGYVKCNPPGMVDEHADETCAGKYSDVDCARAFFVEFKWAAHHATVPEVQSALAEGVSCPRQAPLDQDCLARQREKLAQALPAAMSAAAAPETKAFVGEGAGYNPKPLPGVVPACE